MKKICVVTGTRSDYGLLHRLIEKIKQDDVLDLQLVVTGMHLSPEFGLTYKEIEKDGFSINEKIEILLSSDTRMGVSKAIGLATISFTDCFSRLKPDVLLILGDRFEMLAAAQVAFINDIPIAHIHGGEITHGAYDDVIRHSITKMSYLHFTSSDEHKRRVIQLGESPKRVWNVGALGIENILNGSLLTKKQLFNELGIFSDKEYFVITYHPETNGCTEGIHILLSALNSYKNTILIFTKSNADNGGRYINDVITDYVQKNTNAYLFDSLGQLRYLTAIKYAKVVIGNSSSGLIEAPYLKTPTVNCGNRQGGRQRPNSVFDASMTEKSLYKTVEKALGFDESYEQIFGDGSSSQKIIDILRKENLYRVRKEFVDL